MSSTNGSTMLVCLFHHDDQANAALADLADAGIPQTSISVIGENNQSSGPAGQSSGSATLETLGVPARDLKHLRNGIADGGSVVAVSIVSEHVDTVERIFGKHRATKIDETDIREGERDSDLAAAPLAAAGAVAKNGGERTIPIVEEELEVGKRTVDQGGVRVYRRVIEMPAEQSVNLREEHVVVERNAVDRPATEADMNVQREGSIELTETVEEAVVSKNARVVEEVVIGKEVSEHTHHIQDTVRRTELEVEQLPAENARTGSKGSL